MRCGKGTCPRQAVKGRARCEQCLEWAKAAQRNRKARGLCPSCPTHTGDGRTCDRCKERRLANDRAKRRVGLR